MDRQSLLEQKRQRLQELKKRRQQVSDVDGNSVDKIIENLETTRKEVKLVDVGVQVNSISSETPSYFKPVKEKEFIMFDKAIQVDMPVIIESSVKEKVVETESSKFELNMAKNINEDELNENVKDTLKLVNKLIIEESIDISSITDYRLISKEHINTSEDKNIPIKKLLEIKEIGHRSINYIDSSPHYNELVVVAYSSKNILSKDSPGYAIIYNTAGEKEFPEYFLKCTSSINIIKFDLHNPNKIFGGLEDGRVVLWDLTYTDSTSIAILPHLSSPILKMYHPMGITSINQIIIDGNDCIITSSLDGTLNIWSTSFLASPKVKPIKITSEEISQNIRIFDAILSEDIQYKSRDSISPDYNFLNRLVIGYNMSFISQLQNDKELLKKVLKDNTSKLHTSMITSMHFLESNFIITAGLDWYIKIWTLSSSTPILKIPTRYPIIGMAKRPNRNLQFAIIGNCGNSLIQFWDLNAKLMNPVFEIALHKEIPTRVYFDGMGEVLIISFESGKVMTWKVDDVLLKEKILSDTNSKVDNGIYRLLKEHQGK